MHQSFDSQTPFLLTYPPSIPLSATASQIPSIRLILGLIFVLFPAGICSCTSLDRLLSAIVWACPYRVKFLLLHHPG